MSPFFHHKAVLLTIIMLRIFACSNRLHTCCPYICIVLYAIKGIREMGWDGLGIIVQGEESVVLKNTHKVLFPRGNNKNTQKKCCSLEGTANSKSDVPLREQQILKVIFP